MSRCLVTGGAGFIGSHVADRLIDLGHEVVVVDNLSLGRKEFVHPKAEFHCLDIRQSSTIRPLMQGCEVVFHLAADPRLQVSVEQPFATHATNVDGTLALLELAHAAKVKKFIFSSSCSVYGDQPLPISEAATPRPKSPYGLQKLIGEHYLRLFCELYGLVGVSLRYFNVYGPRKSATGSYPMVIPIFLRQRAAGQPLTIVGDGKQTRDYVHVSDVVEANLRAWQSPLGGGEVINIGSGEETSVEKIATLIGGPATHLPARPGEMRFIAADIAEAKELLGWRPLVSLETGIAELKNSRQYE